MGCRLAEDIVAIEDSPPFDKAMMDGWAIRIDDFEQPSSRFQIQQRLTAGQIAEQDLPIIEYPLPEVIERNRQRSPGT